ncbi:BLUF domain-containing protein [Nocardioides caldifontis]|uniref:BLUF domain-containing protein n=1 Tax=Nocardioides caldifontis TaxID=2588938 RepID=UPI0011DFEF90|nr:BLUF domain-containing protein [Nocardioides caldifontis]
MHSLVYVSSATELLDRDELEQFLAVSRRNNAAAGITGMLLYKDGNLMQVLEGEEPAVRETYARIALDARHRGLLVLLEDTVDQRQFEDWTMAFRDLETDEAKAAPGYSAFLNTPLDGPELTEDPGAARRLLTTFKESM